MTITINITVFNSDGEITKNLSGQEEELLLLNVEEGEGYISGLYPEEDYYIEGNIAVLKPPRPNGHGWVFDYKSKSWANNISDAQLVSLLSKEKDRAREYVLSETGKKRAKYITVLPGQEMSYMTKERIAKLFLSGQTLDPIELEVLESEVPSTAPTVADVALVIVNLADIWIRVSNIIDRSRYKAMDGIALASNSEEVVQCVLSFISEISIL